MQRQPTCSVSRGILHCDGRQEVTQSALLRSPEHDSSTSFAWPEDATSSGSRTSCHCPLPRPRRPQDPQLHPRQAEANQVAGGYLSITYLGETTYYNFNKATNSNLLVLTCASSISPPAPSPTPTPSASPLCVNNLINGNFENNLTGWVYEDIGLEQLGTTIGLNNNHWVDLNSCQLGYIEQTINTNIGYSYTIYYCLSGNNFTRDDNTYSIKEGRISVRPEGESIDNITGSEDFSFDTTTATYNVSNPKDIDMNWTNKSFIFTATSGRTTLRFQGLAPANNCFGAAIDNVSVIESNCYHQRDCNSPSPTPTPTPTSTPIFMSADPISFRISTLSV